MEYSKIVSVTGLPGLFEILTSKTDGAIVRGLEDKATKFISSRQHNLSHLESIEVYTVTDNVNLADIFIAMQGGTALPDEKDAKAVKSYFEKVYPDLDFERVYHSDMKKMVRWFSILQANGVEIKLTPFEEDEEEVAEEAPVVEAAPEEKPVKKAKAKKSASADDEKK